MKINGYTLYFINDIKSYITMVNYEYAHLYSKHFYFILDKPKPRKPTFIQHCRILREELWYKVGNVLDEL